MIQKFLFAPNVQKNRLKSKQKMNYGENSAKKSLLYENNCATTPDKQYLFY